MGMANVLNEEKKQQVLALGRLGWSLRRIQQATRIRRETANARARFPVIFEGCSAWPKTILYGHARVQKF